MVILSVHVYATTLGKAELIYLFLRATILNVDSATPTCVEKTGP